tara:strand:+ start:427 stop:537 length:111 start_codon:yes stop_codon:yes gene_type:complete
MYIQRMLSKVQVPLLAQAIRIYIIATKGEFGTILGG